MLSVGIAVIALAVPALALEQGATSSVTGRATDSSDGALPGVTVSITSPNLIGGARSSVTDEQGICRFTQLPAGVYAVKFELAGFTILNIESVQVSGGATMTINGKLQVASLAETITVIQMADGVEQSCDAGCEPAGRWLCVARRAVVGRGPQG